MSRRGILCAQGKRLAAARLVPPGSIDGTGATNVSAALQAWIDAQPNGSAIDFVGKNYRIDQTLVLNARSNLSFFNGRFFTDAPTPDGSPIDTTPPYDSASRTRSQWLLTGCTNIKFLNMTIRGANPAGGVGDAAYEIALEAQMGFWVSASTGVEIGNCLITDIYGDYVYCSDNSQNVTIYGNECTRNGRQGFAFVNSSRIIVRDNNVYNNRRAFVDIEPNFITDVCDDILIENNAVGPTRLLFVTAGGSGNVNNVRIRYNTLTGKELQLSVAAGGPRSNFLIEYNTSDFEFGSTGTVEDPAVSAYFENVNGLIYRNNYCPVQSGRPCSAIGIWHCTGVDIRYNTVPNGAKIATTYDSYEYRNNRIDFYCNNRFATTDLYEQPIPCPLGA